MSNILFSDVSDITDQWLTYIGNEVVRLTHESEDSIDSYIDSEIENPEIIAILDSNTINLDDVPVQPEDYDLVFEKGVFLSQLFKQRIPKFRRLKRKIKSLLCKAISELGSQDFYKIDLKDILLKILIYLLPFWGRGIPKAILSILVGLLARLFKRGFNRFCY